MVMCNMESVVIPRPPALPPLLNFPVGLPMGVKFHNAHDYVNKPLIHDIGVTNNQPRAISNLPTKPPPIPKPNKKTKSASIRSQRSTHSSGFRLLDDQLENGSVYSVYKQKIDAMFDSDNSLNTNNSVQARIEKMFSDVALDSGIDDSNIGLHSFTVDYLGSVPLNSKVTSLAGLQSPLKDLYFAYKRTTKMKKMLTGRLEISSQGLKVQYQGEKGDLEQLNSFPTIAVWSAVKFVIHDNPKKSYAFLPLITDPDNLDKQALFQTLDQNEKKYITSEAHSPLFAVVMRKIGVHKQLECHGFVCQTSEDAIVVAATLYKSLMSHMRAKEKKPKSRNGITCMSLASSVCNERSSASNINVPVRPPRRKRSTTSSTVSDVDQIEISDKYPLLQASLKRAPKRSMKNKRAPTVPSLKQDLDTITSFEDPNNITGDFNTAQLSNQTAQNEDGRYMEIKPQSFSEKLNTFMSKEQKQITAEIKQVMSEGTNKGLKRSQSVRKRSDGTLRKKENSGDILTKVTIPRSGSFLNAGGLTRYKSKVSRNNGQASGGSPLGFDELFNEFRLQEGLHSMDEILGVIIDPEGMSFNDLKPIYKEFLLKLSVTLTKDELYQRSKSIMRRQKKKVLKRSLSSTGKPSHRVLVGSKFKQLKHVFQRNFYMKSNKSSKKGSKTGTETVNSKLPESTISSSSYDTRQFRPKEPANQITRKPSYKKKEFKSRRDKCSTSEDSDFLSARRAKMINNNNNVQNVNQNRNSSSGYVSCSDCSYDSDSCTCVSADKCYCSLGNKNFSRKHNTCQSKHEDKCCCAGSTPMYCGCDTDSCTESNKCYCQQFGRTSSLFAQLKERGLVPQNGEVSLNVPTKHRKLCKKSSNTKSTKSLEYMPNPSAMYYERLKHGNERSRAAEKTRDLHFYSDRQRHRGYGNDSLALDYELFTITNGNTKRMQDVGSYARALSETGHIGLQKHSSVRSYRSAKYGSICGKTLQSTAITGGECTEALSVKKSAEIAALFADIKLSQTTDIKNLARSYNLGSMMGDAHSNSYNKMKTAYSKSHRGSSHQLDLRTVSQYGGHNMVQNSLYKSTNMAKPQGRNMYSTKNGLYTIQSQSDDSRKSSVGEVRKFDGREYYDLDTHMNGSDSINLESSLGYLP